MLSEINLIQRRKQKVSPSIIVDAKEKKKEMH